MGRWLATTHLLLLFYSVTSLFPWGEVLAPEELMHQEGWGDHREILIFILNGKIKRISKLLITPKEAVMLRWGEESSKLAKELCGDPESSSPGEIKASPSLPVRRRAWQQLLLPRPHAERKGPGRLPNLRPSNPDRCWPYRPVHQPFLKMGPARGRVLYVLGALQDDPVHQFVLQVRVLLLLDLLLHLSA
jgi:hypothetical protein